MNWNDKLSTAVKSVAPSGIRRFFDIAAKMQDVISLGVGEPDFVTPWSIRESCVYGLERGYTSYTANRGMLKLREEIARHYREKFNVAYDVDTEILVTVGVSEALDIALRAILNPGDEVLCLLSSLYVACERRPRQRAREDRKRIPNHARRAGTVRYGENQSDFDWLPEQPDRRDYGACGFAQNCRLCRGA